MYKRHKIQLITIFLISLLIQIYFKADSTHAVENLLMTYFSISFGFCAVCMSTLHGSNISALWYNEVDEEKITQRKIHTVKNYYATAFCIQLISIFLIIIFTVTKYSEFKINVNCIYFILNKNFIISKLSYIVISLFSTSIYITLLTMHLTLTGIVKEAKNIAKNIK